MHKGKKEAYSADMKRKEGIRDAVAPAAAAYEEAKKTLKEASDARRAAVKEAQDPPASVRQCAFAAFHFGIYAGQISLLCHWNIGRKPACMVHNAWVAPALHEITQGGWSLGALTSNNSAAPMHLCFRLHYLPALPSGTARQQSPQKQILEEAWCA